MPENILSEANVSRTIESFCLFGVEMKRVGNLWEQLVSEENFEKAWKLTRKGKGRRWDVQKFESNYKCKLEKLRQQLINDEYELSKYKNKVIKERGKIRKLYILPLKDRIVQHALVNVIEDIFVKSFITDTYGCIKGRGQLKGSMKVRKIIQLNSHCLKLDIRQFYPTMNHDVLFNYVCRKIKDKKVLELLRKTIYSVEGEVNSPIGNLTSQLFGNIYLSKLDRYCKEILKIKYYLRYCDDIVILDKDKKYLIVLKKKIENFIKNELKQELSKAQIFDVKQGIDFLGYRHFKNRVLLRKSIKLRAERMLKKISSGKDMRSINTQISAINSVSGILQGTTTNLRDRLNVEDILIHLMVNNFKENRGNPNMILCGLPIQVKELINKEIVALGYFNTTKSMNKNKVKAIKVSLIKDGVLRALTTSSEQLINQLERINEILFPVSGTLTRTGIGLGLT